LTLQVNFLGPVAQKPVSPKIQSKLPNSFVYKLGNISSKILSGSMRVFFSEVFKQIDNRNT
jgi:hypothetical protein